MKDYSYAEIGMLIGTAIGGVVSVMGFSFTGNYLFFIAAGVGIAIGLNIGSNMDKKKYTKNTKNHDL